MWRAVARQLPTWNKSVLDLWLKRAFEQADPTRPTVAHSGVGPHLPQLDGTDTHLWLGWHRGEVGDLAERARLVPRAVRFVSEFGAQSVPDSAVEFVDASRWPELDWESLREHHGLEVEVMRARVPPDEHPTLRRLAQRDPALPGHRAAPPPRDAAPAQVPPDGRLLVLVAGRSGADDLGLRPRPRAGAEAGVVDDRRDLPAGDRRHRPAAAPSSSPATSWPSTSTSSTTCASPSSTPPCRSRARGAAVAGSGRSAAMSTPTAVAPRRPAGAGRARPSG